MECVPGTMWNWNSKETPELFSLSEVVLLSVQPTPSFSRRIISNQQNVRAMAQFQASASCTLSCLFSRWSFVEGLWHMRQYADVRHWVMAPMGVHALISGTSNWEIILGYLYELSIITWVLKSREPFPANVRKIWHKKNTEHKERLEVWEGLHPPLLPLRWRKGDTSQGMQMASVTWEPGQLGAAFSSQPARQRALSSTTSSRWILSATWTSKENILP